MQARRRRDPHRGPICLQRWSATVLPGRPRNAACYATASVTVVLDEPTRSVRLALGGARYRRPRSRSQAIGCDGVDWHGRTVTDDGGGFRAAAAQAADPVSDFVASADYRRRAVEVMARRALRHIFDEVPMSGGERVSYTLTVNGRERRIESAWYFETLLEVLRNRLGLTGTKVRLRHRAMRAYRPCRRSAGQRVPGAGGPAEGQQITTIEGYSPPDGSP